MSNKPKKISKNNLQKIREELRYTQKQMGEKLGVSEKTIRNYEYFETDFPIESALYLSKHYNYTLDWIYCNSDIPKKQSTSTNNETSFPKFIVDIRDFISYSNGMIHLTIPNYYWNYINERNSITSSKDSIFEKRREIAKLEAKYDAKIPQGHCWRFSISASEFNSFVRVNDSFIPYADSISEEIEPSEEDLAKITSLFNEFLK